MQLFVTTEGIARRSPTDPDLLEIIAPADRDLAPHLSPEALAALEKAEPKARVALVDASFLPPIARPGRFVIAGLNYRAHCEEVGRPVPEQLVFAPAIGEPAHASGAPVRIPAEATEQIDYEGEVAVVIGTSASSVDAADAWSVIAGLMPLNDVSARDVQAGATLEAVGRAKGFPTFKPMGPALATADEFPDPLDVGIRTWVNGELRQSGRTGDMVFRIPEIVALVSARIPLEPGDVICTGTPGGVAHGGAHPYLVPGDVVEVELEGLPRLSNRFEAE